MKQEKYQSKKGGINMETSKLANHLEQFDYEYLLEHALSKVSDDIDKREGSIIFDALAPACMELALMYMRLRDMYHATFIQTAFDHYLDLRVEEHGLKRQQATRAIRVAQLLDEVGKPMLEIAEHTRFATAHPTNSIIYRVKSLIDEEYLENPDNEDLKYPEIDAHSEALEDGQYPGADEENVITKGGLYELESEEPGIIGNDFEGRLLPVDTIQGLGSAVMLSGRPRRPGQDEETDDLLRTRFLTAVRARPFGGNVAQYREEILLFDGIGAVQIHPAWLGGGTVKCVILDSNFDPVSKEMIEVVKNELDPKIEGKTDGYGKPLEEGIGLGLAPIGHRVTVATALPKKIKVAVNISYSRISSLDSLQTPITEAIEDYFKKLRREWDQGDEFNEYDVRVRTSQISALLLQINGITDVRNVWLSEDDDASEAWTEGNITLRQKFHQEPTADNPVRGGYLPYLHESGVTFKNENEDTEYGAS